MLSVTNVDIVEGSNGNSLGNSSRLQEALTLPKRAVVNDLDKLFIGINQSLNRRFK